MHGNCKCGHHVCAKVLMVLAWLAAIAFWWTSWKSTIVWDLDSTEWFFHVVVLGILAFGTKFCGCCWKGKMMDGNMNCACSCGSCEGNKCGGSHSEGHRHM